MGTKKNTASHTIYSKRSWDSCASLLKSGCECVTAKKWTQSEASYSLLHTFRRFTPLPCPSNERKAKMCARERLFYLNAHCTDLLWRLPGPRIRADMNSSFLTLDYFMLQSAGIVSRFSVWCLPLPCKIGFVSSWCVAFFLCNCIHFRCCCCNLPVVAERWSIIEQKKKPNPSSCFPPKV